MSDPDLAAMMRRDEERRHELAMARVKHPRVSLHINTWAIFWVCFAAVLIACAIWDPEAIKGFFS